MRKEGDRRDSTYYGTGGLTEQRTNERCREKEKNCEAVHARLRRRTFARRL